MPDPFDEPERCWACNSSPCRCDRDYELIAGKLVIRDRMFAATLAGCIGLVLAAAVVGAPGVGWAALAVALLIPAVWR